MTLTVILGGGLSGLYAAVLLHRQERDFELLEARDRLGGRILSESFPESEGGPAFDLGPAWFWPEFQPRMVRLLDELGIGSFPQPEFGEAVFEDETGKIGRFPGFGPQPRSYRIEGGVARLIEGLAAVLPAARIHRSSPVRRLRRDGERVRVEVAAADGTQVVHDADRVLLAAPPRFLAENLQFEPALPGDVRSRFLEVPTWMAGHAKVLAIYERSVWRERGLSGQAFSRRGPLAEIHDASPRDGGPYALFGFVRSGGSKALIEPSVRQFERLLGPGLGDPLHVLVKDWADDPWTATPADLDPPAGHPAYGLPAAVQELWDGRLRFCSTETSARNGGYLEGALEAAVEAVIAAQPTRGAFRG